MGSWFSNIHIRKSERFPVDAVAESIRKVMGGREYLPVSTEEEADGAVAIVSDDGSGWISVYSELLTFEEPEQFAEMAMPMSTELQADVLGISCFDSDYLYLNLINAKDKTNAWVGIGSAAAYEIRRRTNLRAWEKIVEEFPRFSECARKKYIFAEEFLSEVSECLSLPAEYSAADYEYLQELGSNAQVKYLYFKLAESAEQIEGITGSDSARSRVLSETRLMIEQAPARPCLPEQTCTVFVRNMGGASKGLSVYFLGPYVENEELTFSDTVLGRWKGDFVESSPFELQKIRLPDGQWAYHYHDPDYQILPRLGKIDGRLPLKKQLQMDRDQSVIVSFIPHGNRRKVLDVTVVLVPDQNPAGQVSWNVWKNFGSKKAYFSFQSAVSNLPGFESFQLRREDFD